MVRADEVLVAVDCFGAGYSAAEYPARLWALVVQVAPYGRPWEDLRVVPDLRAVPVLFE